MGKLVSNLRDVVRKLAYSTSVDQLKKKGVDKVSVLGMDRIAFLIQEAVKNSLRYRLLSLDREEVAFATKEEFLRLLRSNEDLERQHDELQRHKAQAELQVDELRRELAQQRQLLAQKLDPAVAEDRYRLEGDVPDIEARLRELIDGLTAAGKGAEVPDRVLEFVLELVGQARQDAQEARQAVRDREVLNLQRRIEKLSASLSETEHRLTQVTAIKHIDEGISSLYREVQGIDSADKEFATKTALMASIFEANLRLQGR